MDKAQEIRDRVSKNSFYGTGSFFLAPEAEELVKVLDEGIKARKVVDRIRNLISMKEDVIRALKVDVQHAWDEDLTFRHSLLSENLSLLEMQVSVLRSVLDD